MSGGTGPSGVPAGTVAMVGPGAHAAVRGLLVAALTQAVEAGQRPQVIVTGETLMGLLGSHATDLSGWPRIRVASGTAKALQLVEAWLLEISRLQLAHDTPAAVGQGATGGQTASTSTTDPASSSGMLLVAATTGRTQSRQLRAVAGQAGPRFSALLVGSWPYGPAVHVDADGITTSVGAYQPETGLPPKLVLLDESQALQVLLELKQVETGQTPPPAVIPVAEPAAAPYGPDTARARVGPTAARPPGRQRIRPAVVKVLGTPSIVHARAAGRPVRQAALELLVYLAVHPEGAAVEQICDDLWPDVRRFQSSQRLHTAASNLRHLLAAAAGADAKLAGAFAGKELGRYRLNPQLVEVDLWQLRDAVAAARNQQHPHQRRQALQRACQVYGGPLADGCNYQWIGVYREQVREWACQAHRHLAETTSDPRDAARLLAKAARIDPADEDTCRQAMKACAAAGDIQTIRTLLNNLSEHLDTTGGQPARETTALAEQLLHSAQRSRDGSP